MANERRTLMDKMLSKGFNEAFAISLDNYLKTNSEVKRMLSYLRLNKNARPDDIIGFANGMRFEKYMV